MLELTQPEIVERGTRLLIDGRYEDLLVLVEAALESFPDDPEIRYLYAVAVLPHSPDEAVAQATMAIELEPDNPWRLVRATGLLFGRADFEIVREYIHRAVELMPENFEFAPELANLRAKLADVEGDDELAEEGFRAALDTEPHRSDFAYDLAAFLAERARNREALVVVDNALRITPDDRKLSRLREELAR